MKFLVDADLPNSLITFLKSHGYDTLSVREIFPPATPDDKVYQFAKEGNRILVTRDKDFTNILLYPPEENFAIIVFRTHLVPYDEMFTLLNDFLQRIPTAELLGSLVIIQKNRIRIRKP
jgi:predicted nuclease of predicted toxin-antitoxin system